MERPQSFPQAELTAKHLEKDERLYVEAIERVNEILKHEIDYAVIGNILEEICGRCFPDRSKGEIVFSRIEEIKNGLYSYHVKYVDVEEGENGDISFSKNRAQIKSKSITFFAKEFLNDEDKIDAQLLTDTIIHELLHLVTWGHEQNKNEKGVLMMSGVMYKEFSFNEQSELHIGEYFRSLNEGLTELIKDAVYSEYQARKGIAFDYPEYGMAIESKDGSVISPLMRSVAYNAQRMDVQILVDEIYKATEIPLEDIWRSLVSEYFTNGNLTRAELLKLYGDHESLASLVVRLSEDLHARDYPQAVANYNFYNTIFIEQDFVKALFGRDVIGRYNKKIKEDVY